MFSYKLPAGDLTDVVTLDAEGNIKFEPLLSEQQHMIAAQILEDPRWNCQLKKVVDFGCGEMSLFRYIRRLEHVEHILNVDLDEEILTNYQSRATPLIADHLKQRDRPLRVEVLKGNIIHSVENLQDVDAVVAIEVIEHLVQDALEKLPENIFGFIQPKLVIVSTPNQDYNVMVLLKGLNSNGFRTDDHKFEWDRKQFKGWAASICNKYKNYSFASLGVGSAPTGCQHRGTAIQVGIFARNDIIDRPLEQPIYNDLKADKRKENQYKLIYAVDFPFRKDERTKEQKLKDEITYYLSFLRRNNNYYNEDLCVYKIPIDRFVGFAEKMPEKMTKTDVLLALKELNYEVDKDCIILTNDVDEHFKLDCCDLKEDLQSDCPDIDDDIEELYGFDDEENDDYSD